MSEDLGRNKHLKVSSSDAQISESRQVKQTKKTTTTSKKPCMYTSTPQAKATGELLSTSHRIADDTIPSLLSLNMLQTSYINDDTADPSQLRMSMLKSVSKPEDLDAILGNKVPNKVTYRYLFIHIIHVNKYVTITYDRKTDGSFNAGPM